MSTPLPDFQMDVEGRYYGGAYYHDAEYRVRIESHGHEEGWLLEVEDAAGTKVGGFAISPDEVDGITSMAHIDHGLGGYQDDWTLPEGMGRTLVWTLPTDDRHYVELDDGQIDQVAAWLEYATGEETYDGDPERWEF